MIEDHDGTMLNPRIHRSLEEVFNLIWIGTCRNIYVMNLFTQNGIPDTATDKVSLITGLFDRLEDWPGHFKFFW